MVANGQLVFTDVDKVTFKGVGGASNAVIDTTTGKIGVGVDSPDANLHVLGNCFVSTNFELGGTMTMGTVTVRAQHELSAITATGNTTPHTVEFQNAETSLVTTGNVEVGKDLTVSGNVAVDIDTLFVDSVNDRVGVGTNSPDRNFHVLGTSRFDGEVEWYKVGERTSHANYGSNRDWYIRSGSTAGKVIIQDGGGNVGIGTTNPGAPLHVYNNSLGGNPGDSTDILKFGGNSSGAGALLLTAERLSSGSTWTSTGLRLQKIVDATKMAYVQFGSNTSDASGELLFGTGDATERMRITSSGNVGIGTTDPGYKLEVNGKMGQNGKEIYNQLRWEIDLTSQSNTAFYPIEFTHPSLEGTPDLPDMHPIHFKIFGESLGAVDPFNENTLVGYAKGGGWSDHGPMYDVHVERHTGSETRFQGLYEGTSTYMNGIVIYMRGGYRYSTLTDATEVVTHTSAYTNGSATFALKNSSGADVSGTSAAINQLVNIAGSTRGEQRWMSGTVSVSGNVGIGVADPSHGRMQLLCSSQSPNGGLTIRGGDFNAGLGAMWVEGSGSAQRFNIQAYKNEGLADPAGVNPSTADADAFRLCLNPKGGNVGIGEASPTQLIHARGTGPQLFIEGATNENAVIRGSSGPAYRDKYHEISMGFFALPTFGTSNYIDFKVNEGGESNSPSTRMRIRGDGRVGIGTTSPDSTLDVHGIVTATNLDLEGTVIRSGADITLTAGTWAKIADFSSLPTGGYYLISIKWSNSTFVSTGATCIWYGGVTYSTYVVGGTDLYNATGQENITYNANYHYRAIDPFLFIQDSDASAGSYGKHSIYMKSPQSDVLAKSVAVVAYRIS